MEHFAFKISKSKQNQALSVYLLITCRALCLFLLGGLMTARSWAHTLAQEDKSLTSEVLIFTKQGTAIHLYSINATEGALQNKTTQIHFFTTLKGLKIQK